jgi:hypothetical protein
MEPSDTPELYQIAQFVVPRLAADALEVSRIRREADMDGIAGTNVELDTRRAGAGKTRVTCRTMMAMRYIVEWKRIGASAPHTEKGVALREATRLAIVAATAGCCEAWGPRRLSMGESGYVG